MFSPAANRRYTTWTAVCFTAYLIITSISATGLFSQMGLTGTLLLGIALAVPVAAHAWASLALIRDADEFARLLTLKRFVIAGALCAVVFTSWGLLESHASIVHAPGWVIYPLFWVAFAVVSLFVRTSHP